MGGGGEGTPITAVPVQPWVGVQQQESALSLGVEEAQVHAGVGCAPRTLGRARVVRVGIDCRLTSGESHGGYGENPCHGSPVLGIPTETVDTLV